jgi:hypothetical protein
MAEPSPVTRSEGPKRRRLSRGATLENGAWVKTFRELQLVEPVQSMVPAPSPGRGRPTLYTEELADMICVYLAQGKTLLEICTENKSLNQSTIRAWAATNYRGFSSKYERAKETGLDAMVEQLFQIADDASKDYIERVVEGGKTIRVPDLEHIARSRLRIDTRKWYISKLAPKRYGHQVDVQRSEPQDSSLVALLSEVCTTAELEDLNARLLAHEARQSATSTGARDAQVDREPSLGT